MSDLHMIVIFGFIGDVVDWFPVKAVCTVLVLLSLLGYCVRFRLDERFRL